MFLTQLGHSKRFTFDIIYSALQKSLRRGNNQLSIEMGYEFIDYPNALKKRLIQNCTEDCPDLYLINDIFNTPSDLRQLMPFIPVICKHVKNHDGCFGMRIACEMKPITSPPNLGANHDDLQTLLCKLLSHITQKEELKFISFFQKRYPTINLTKIYNFIDKHITFLYMLCVWESVEYVHEEYHLEQYKFDENKVFDMNLKLPEYVFDRHVKISPTENRTYSFFLDNLILYPRKEESEIEKKGKKIYLQTNKGVGEFIKLRTKEATSKKKRSQKTLIQMFNFEDINSDKNEDNNDGQCNNNQEDRVFNIDIKNIDDQISKEKVCLIQTQLITRSNKPKCYYCSLNGGESFDFILKGPFQNQHELNLQLLSDQVKKKLLPMPSSYSSKKVSMDNGDYYLAHNLIPIEKDNLISKSSKLEENSMIYNGNKFMYTHDIVNRAISTNEAIELLKVLAFRKIIGTDDTCARNILYFNKHFYTIDDPVLLRSSKTIFEMPLEKLRNAYEKLVWKNFKSISIFLNEWNEIISNADDIPDNVKTFILNQISKYLIITSWVFC